MNVGKLIEKLKVYHPETEVRIEIKTGHGTLMDVPVVILDTQCERVIISANSQAEFVSASDAFLPTKAMKSNR